MQQRQKKGPRPHPGTRKEYKMYIEIVAFFILENILAYCLWEGLSFLKEKWKMCRATSTKTPYERYLERKFKEKEIQDAQVALWKMRLQDSGSTLQLYTAEEFLTAINRDADFADDYKILLRH